MASSPPSARQEGNCLAADGDFPAAAGAFRRALSQDPASSDLHELLAQCLLQTGQFWEAFESARAAVELSPGWAEGHLTLGRAARECGAPRDALSAFRTCKALDPANPEVDDELSQAMVDCQMALAGMVGLPGLRVAEEYGGEGGPGCVVWDSGVMLAAFLIRRMGSRLAGEHVLELGSGTGLVGIVAARMGGVVTLSDVPAALPLLRRNVEENAAEVANGGGKCDVVALDWANVEHRLEVCGKGGYDLVLGSDLVYSGAQVGPLAATLRVVVECSGPVRVLLAHKSRDEGLDADWLSAMAGVGLQLRELAVRPADLGLQGAARVKLYSTYGHRSRASLGTPPAVGPNLARSGGFVARNVLERPQNPPPSSVFS